MGLVAAASQGGAGVVIYQHCLGKTTLGRTAIKLREAPEIQLRPEGRNRRGETRLRGPEVLLGLLRGLGIRPLVSVIRGL